MRRQAELVTDLFDPAFGPEALAVPSTSIITMIAPTAHHDLQPATCSPRQPSSLPQDLYGVAVRDSDGISIRDCLPGATHIDDFPYLSKPFDVCVSPEEAEIIPIVQKTQSHAEISDG